MKKATAIVLMIVMLLLAAGCADNGGEPKATHAPAVSEASTEKPTESPAPTATPAQTATPAPDPKAAEALAAAERHGLSAEDIRGEYELFIRFAEAVESDPAIGRYEGLVFAIFPVIADNAEFIDTDHLISRLSSLSFSEREIEPGIAGQYRYEPNEIIINTDLGESDDSQLPSIVFHELMHFVDFSADGEEHALYLIDGERLTADEFLARSLDDQIRAVILYESDPVKEGCAELFTAKYFAGAIRSYFGICQFMSGLEYVYGEDALRELFFSGDSDALFAELFLDAGFTPDRYYDAAASLNWLTDPTSNYRPGGYIMPEDILIELYEHKLGGDWRTDEPFLYILKAVNGIAWSGYEDSSHAEFLKDIEFNTRRQYEEFAAKVYADLPFEPEIRYLPPTPIIRDGRYLIGAFAEWRDPETGKTVRGTIAAEYDFKSERPVGYEIIDMDAVRESRLG